VALVSGIGWFWTAYRDKVVGDNFIARFVRIRQMYGRMHRVSVRSFGAAILSTAPMPDDLGLSKEL
jgi:hypothetical protein